MLRDEMALLQGTVEEVKAMKGEDIPCKKHKQQQRMNMTWEVLWRR